MKHLLIAKNTIYQALARVSTSLIGFIITIIIAKTFGVLGYGEFIKITAYVALFYLILDFGLNAIYLQYEKSNFKQLFYLRLLISLVVFASLNLIALVLPYDSILNSGFSDSTRIGIFIYSITVFSQSIIISVAAVFQKNKNYLSYAIGIIVGSVVNLVLVLISAFLNFSIFLILFAFIASSFVSALLLIFLTRESIFPISLNRNMAKEILLKSLPIGMMLIFNLIYFRADIFLLSIYSSTNAVGIYGLSYKFFDFLIALPLFLSNAIYPFLLEAKNEKHKFFNLTKNYLFVFLVFSFVVMIPFWFISPLFLLIKADFVNSIIPFRILLLSLPFFFATSFLQWVLITLGKQKFLMYVYFCSTVINVLLNIIFIPHYSYIACATITFISEALVLLLLIIETIKMKILLERKI
jgi:O-antigen/teichoic acid export membrane protein